jgi:formylglycine-generating enzyme required for sulfatase activity
MKFLTPTLLCLLYLTTLPQTHAASLLSIKDQAGNEVLKYKGSYALVIGVSRYQDEGWPDLYGVEQDIKEVAKILQELNFKVTTHLNPTGNELTTAYEEFIQKYGQDESNRLLFWYAGHGHSLQPKWAKEEDSIGYLVPTDAPSPRHSQSKFKRKALSMVRMEEYALEINSKHALFLFDSCFSGSLFNLLNRAIPEDISFKTANPVRQFITAGRANETVPDKSIFKSQFIKALGGDADRDKDGYLTATELGAYLEKKVAVYSKGTQHPQYGKIKNDRLDDGDFVFSLPKVQQKPLYQNQPPLPEVDYAGFYAQLSDLEQTLATGRSQHNRQKLQQAQGAYNKLRGVANADKTILARVGKDLGEAFRELYQYEKDQQARQEKSQNQAKINALLKKVRKIPASKVQENLEGYEQLLRLDPDNQHFKNKIAHYRKELNQTNTSSRPPHVIPDPDPESRNPTTHTNSIGMKFVLIPAGSFQMGSTSSESGRYDDEGPVHQVRITRKFYLSKYEVTQGQWEEVMERNPSSFKNCGRDCPVEQVGWGSVQAFIRQLNAKEGCVEARHASPGCYRLPTEAEWEYAARAGTRTKYHWGNDFDCSKVMAENDPGSSETKCVSYVKRRGLTADSTAPVGSYPSNPWGLFDMSGNVWEWVNDYWKDSYSSGSQTDPVGPSGVSYRVYRGGGWGSSAPDCRSAGRSHDSPSGRYAGLGFRLLRTP